MVFGRAVGTVQQHWPGFDRGGSVLPEGGDRAYGMIAQRVGL